MRLVSVFAAMVMSMISLTASAGDAYSVDTVHSTVLFRLMHMNVSQSYGRFNEISGTVMVDEADPSKSSFDVTVKVGSVDTGNSKRDQHLKSPDFFSASEFPTISFKSTSVKKAGEKSWEVTGDLTLHGVTKSVTVTMDMIGSGAGRDGSKLVGFETTFSIKRSDFGMGGMLKAIGDEVRITVSIEAGR